MSDQRDIEKELRSSAIWYGNRHFEVAADEIARLRAEIARLRIVKTATLKIADERAKEAVDLRAQLMSARKVLTNPDLWEDRVNNALAALTWRG